MGLANCPRCGKMFNKAALATCCAACKQQEEDDFQACYVFLRENPGCSVAELSRGAKVEERQIMEFYRTGRLVASGEGEGVPCVHCGKPAYRGSYCNACAQKLSSSFKSFSPADPGLGDLPKASDPGRTGRKDISHNLRVDRH